MNIITNSIGIYIAGRLGIFIIDRCILSISHNMPLLNPVNRPKSLKTKDYCYLLINSITETVFLEKLYYKIYNNPVFFDPLEKIIFCFYTLFYLDDIGYIFLHKLLHKFYWLHEHHHQIKIPCRGYIDAANENPIEMLLALLYTYFSIIFLDRVAGVPNISLLLYVFAKAVGSCINHINRPVHINLGFGVVFSSLYHQKHHIYNTCNYGQFTKE